MAAVCPTIGTPQRFRQAESLEVSARRLAISAALKTREHRFTENPKVLCGLADLILRELQLSV